MQVSNENPNQQGKQSVSHILTCSLEIKISQRKNQRETMDRDNGWNTTHSES